MHKRLIVSTCVLVAAGVVTAGSLATAPGKNGRIAFRRYLDANQTWGAIYTINPDGTDPRQITHPPKGVVDDQPEWSKDGSMLVFSSNRDKLGRPANSIYSAVFSMHASGTGVTRLSADCPSPDKAAGCPYDFLPSFSPDGKHVVFAAAPGSIVVANSDGSNAHVVVKATTPDSGHSGYTATDPQLSPDGKRLLFVRENRGNLPPKDAQAIFVADAQGKGARRVTPWSLAAGDNPDWSPDGQWILFHSNANSDKQGQIYVAHPDGSGLKQLTNFKPGAIVTSSSFAPDGKWIVFASTGIGGQADIFVMRSDGTGIRQVTRTKLWESAPDWGPVS
jgi:Tol biopolymer transport system component